jgi:hypothetical protein
MSDRAEELARQLIEKTEGGKLVWKFTPDNSVDDYWGAAEKYGTELDDVFSFSISRKTQGDNKLLEFELREHGRICLSAQANNLPNSSEPGGLFERAASILYDKTPFLRFRLFSDLFYAAKKSAVPGDQTIEKVQQLLERLG